MHCNGRFCLEVEKLVQFLNSTEATKLSVELKTTRIFNFSLETWTKKVEANVLERVQAPYNN